MTIIATTVMRTIASSIDLARPLLVALGGRVQ
jgi:hypothetical protein